MNNKQTLLICLFTIFAHALIAEAPQKVLCSTPNSCSDINNSCKCYCSHICEPRDKKPEQDNPVYVPNDPEGYYCYCKPWDLENYGKRCKVPKRGARK